MQNQTNTNFERKIFDLLTACEQQQEMIQQQQAQLAKMDQMIRNSVSVSIDHALSGVKGDFKANTDDISKKMKLISQEVEKAAKNANRAILSLQKKLGWKLLVSSLAAIAILSLVIITVIMQFVPSLDEVQQRRQEVRQMNQYLARAEISTCNGQTCIRVNRQQCGFGKYADYCVIKARKK